jgi:hypothetical protein
MKTHLTMKVLLKTCQFVLGFFVFYNASAQVLPVLPAPNYDIDHNAVVTGKVTVSGSSQTPAGIVVTLSRVIDGPPVSYVPVSYAITNTSGDYQLSGVAGVKYVVGYEFPTAGFSVSSGNPSTSFTVVAGTNTAPGGGIVLTRVANTITNCNVTPIQATDWTTTLTVAKAIPINNATLNNISVFNSAMVVNPKITITASTAATYAKLDIGARIFIDGPGMQPSNTLESTKKFAGSRTSPTDQRIHLAAEQELTYFDISSAQTVISSLSPAPSDYQGTPADVTFNIEATALTATEFQGGNAGVSLTTNAAAGVCLTYVYTFDPLPVKLASFTAKAETIEKRTSVKVDWVTSSEINRSGFDVQRSLDGKSWMTLETVTSGKKTEAGTQYNFSDFSPSKGENLYRLKMVDLDNSFAYSPIKAVNVENGPTISFYPNPTSDYLKVQAVALEQIKGVSITNYKGQTVLESKNHTELEEGLNVKSLPAGIYFVNLKYLNGTVDTKKVSIVK